MMHRVYGRKLKRNADERKRLFRDLCRSIIRYGRIKTTLAKAKAVQPLVEKLITKAKSETSGSARVVASALSDAVVGKKLAEMVKTRFANRTSGYTRIIKLGARPGDASEIVFLEFVDAEPVKAQKEKESKSEKAPVAPETKLGAAVQEAEVVNEAPRVTKKPKVAKSRK